MKRSAENILASYIDALHPIIYINHFDFKVIDAAIAHVGQGAKCVEFNNALGLVDFKTKSPMKGCSLEEFLKLTMDDGFEQQTFLILKDVHRELDNPKVIAYLKRIAENNLYNENYSATIFIISEVTVIPRELENYITIFDIPLPTIDEIRGIIRAFITDMEIEVDADTIDEIALSFKGLNEFQIWQILTLAYQDGGCITRGDKALILKEKEQFIKKSGMLEIVNFSESIEDIGGLENLKDWLYRKAFIFRELDKAIKFGVDAGEQRRLSTNRDFLVTFVHCIKGHNLSSLDFNDKSSEFLFVEIHCTLRQRSQIPFVVTSGQKSRPGKNIGSIPQRTIERQTKQLAFIIAD